MRILLIIVVVLIVAAGLWYMFGWGRGDGPPTEDTSWLDPGWAVTERIG